MIQMNIHISTTLTILLLQHDIINALQTKAF